MPQRKSSPKNETSQPPPKRSPKNGGQSGKSPNNGTNNLGINPYTTQSPLERTALEIELQKLWRM